LIISEDLATVISLAAAQIFGCSDHLAAKAARLDSEHSQNLTETQITHDSR
jgi:hypothetical protein